MMWRASKWNIKRTENKKRNVQKTDKERKEPFRAGFWFLPDLCREQKLQKAFQKRHNFLKYDKVKIREPKFPTPVTYSATHKRSCTASGHNYILQASCHTVATERLNRQCAGAAKSGDVTFTSTSTIFLCRFCTRAINDRFHWSRGTKTKPSGEG